jgi:hypothetical protein
MKVAKAKGHLRGKQPKLNHRQEAHLVALLDTGEYTTAELADPPLHCQSRRRTRASTEGINTTDLATEKRGLTLVCRVRREYTCGHGSSFQHRGSADAVTGSPYGNHLRAGG